MRAPSFAAVFALLCAATVSACRGGGVDPFAASPDRDGTHSDITALDCPRGGDLPFALESTAWHDEARATAAVAAATPANHFVEDFVGNPGDEVLVGGAIGYGVNIATMQNTLREEFVELWTYLDGAWFRLGRQQTDRDGNFAFAVSAATPFPTGSTPVYVVVAGDQTCAKGAVSLYPPATQVVVTDIDGTLTRADQELFTQLGDLDYVPVQFDDANTLMQNYAAKGYVVIFLTARPFTARMLSRGWLDDLAFPFGHMETADSFVSGDSARQYKRGFIQHITDDLGWQVKFAHGNAESDVDAYDDGGIPKSATYTVNEAAGTKNTVAVPNWDTLGYTDFLASIQTAFPDADQPF